MLPFGDSILLWTLATGISAVVGLFLMSLVGGLFSPRTVAAFALGIFFWFFIDTIQGSSNLFVSQGFGGGLPQLTVVLLFLFGLLAFFQADRGLLSQPDSAVPFAIPLIAALALGMHGFGEGSAFGSTASQTSSTSMLDAFGGALAGVAYVLHKMLEPMMAGALYIAYSRGSQRSLPTSARDTLVLALAFVLPSVVGAAAGYYLSYDSTYFFALGAGASVYVASRLARQVFVGPMEGRIGSLKVGVSISIGFILIYLAALMHS